MITSGPGATPIKNVGRGVRGGRGNDSRSPFCPPKSYLLNAHAVVRIHMHMETSMAFFQKLKHFYLILYNPLPPFAQQGSAGRFVVDSSNQLIKLEGGGKSGSPRGVTYDDVKPPSTLKSVPYMAKHRRD